ncbi:hypothetical protein MesoLjLb_48050 [Mesorhizobium sp. L-8-3]|nr:hypothetical protein MesoLjLb_48050 [Mesorhizobium sp. L-8-3]
MQRIVAIVQHLRHRDEISYAPVRPRALSRGPGASVGETHGVDVTANAPLPESVQRFLETETCAEIKEPAGYRADLGWGRLVVRPQADLEAR